MKFKHAHKLIDKALHEVEIEKVFKVYLVDRQHQLYLFANGSIKRGDIMSFPQYYQNVMFKENLDKRNNDDILAEIQSFNFITQDE